MGLPVADLIHVMKQAARQQWWRHSGSRPPYAVTRKGAGERLPRCPPGAKRTQEPSQKNYVINSYQPLLQKG